MFKKLTLKDKNLYNKYIEKNRFLSCEYSFTTLFMWRNFNNIEYDILNDIFVIKKYDKNEGNFFMEPLGEISDMKLRNLIEDLDSTRKIEKGKWLFGDVSESFLFRLQRLYRSELTVQEEINNFDYLYDYNEFIALKGKKFRKKKNKYNQFVKSYNYKTIIFKKSLEESEKLKCYKFLDKWCLENEEMDEEFLAEIEGTKDLINFLEELNLELIELYAGEELIGISIGEIFNDYIYIVHVEKCLKEFNGAYAFISNSLLKNSSSNLKYVNREDDLGILGLRKSKMSYNPKFFERKYLVRIK
ncbi:DUF2156 domain-containing protein [Clostridium sp. LIBA-8841]|uniref:DUF2156 domain-containing protein n=1 Tax=Clostridium sp. LIBA-8841 TaxID=2987530 RepID=UPI002AC69FA6|nr:phosphatidylglycerol lysyltransferase domain-containing protein [Clostridium sp. LIBA-8841]MDZ5253240.1 phosphatidylglycerol lysyltransferase domain-containing protein [Clostridium sp. LIBA-8841]